MNRVLIFVLCLEGVAFACSGDVAVHGVPNKIELEAPFCAPAPVDAGEED